MIGPHGTSSGFRIAMSSRLVYFSANLLISVHISCWFLRRSAILANARIGREVGHADVGPDALGERRPTPPPAPRRRASRSRRAACSGSRCRAGRRRSRCPRAARRPCPCRSAPSTRPASAARQALVVAELHAAEVHHAVHHRDLDVLALAGAVRPGAARRAGRSRGAGPVPESPICAPVTNGGPSGTPVVLIAPPIACATFS